MAQQKAQLKIASGGKASAGKAGKNTNEPIFDTRIDLDSREKIIAILNARMADTLDVQTQTKFAHWNVKGNDFYQLHLLFDKVAECLEEWVDMIAERTTALGGRANGTLRQSAAASSMDEYPIETVKGMDHVRALSDRLGALANAYREAIDKCDDLEDKGTADLFTELSREADQNLYFLESHIQI
jgi:starvation-inducible DNA-binding protein